MNLDPVTDVRLEENLRCLSDLTRAMEAFSEIEEDHSRWRIARFMREVAMSRHQLRRMNSELRRINSLLIQMLSRLMDESVRLEAERRSTRSTDQLMLQERIAAVDQLVVVVRDLQQQLDDARGAN